MSHGIFPTWDPFDATEADDHLCGGAKPGKISQTGKHTDPHAFVNCGYQRSYSLFTNEFILDFPP